MGTSVSILHLSCLSENVPPRCATRGNQECCPASVTSRSEPPFRLFIGFNNHLEYFVSLLESLFSMALFYRRACSAGHLMVSCERKDESIL